MSTVHLIIKGKVQGVFYRATAKETALSLQLTGWVKNTPEGNVEAIVSGDAEAIKKFIEWCGQGPAKAVVTSVQVNELITQSFTGFIVKK